MGLPPWHIIRTWLTQGLPTPTPYIEKIVQKSRRFPILENYTEPAPHDFWDSFPKQQMPDKPATKVNVKKLKEAINEVWIDLTPFNQKIAMNTIKNLSFGASALGADNLGGLVCENAKSLTDNGQDFTETLAKWIEAGFVAGPFADPPMNNLRINRMAAIMQRQKCRPVLDLSYPEGISYNDAIDDKLLRKVTMSTPAEIGYAIKEAAGHAKISKFDLVDAYKNVPVNERGWRLQGFSWLGKSFIETKLAFGSKKSVSDFDDLGETLTIIAAVKSGIRRDSIHRTLDDTIIVGGKNSRISEFGREYKQLCNNVNIQLAGSCPNNDKAYECKKTGVALGIQFHTDSCTWSLPAHKGEIYITAITEILNKGTVYLRELEELAGYVEHITVMFPFCKAFRNNIYASINDFRDNKDISMRVKPSLRADLHVWTNFVQAALRGLPIPRRQGQPAPTSMIFISDAAGKAEGSKTIGRLGVASIKTDSKLSSFAETTRLWWPETLLDTTDDKGVRFGDKSATLEAVGLLLPFLANGKRLQCKRIILHVDNISLWYGWKKKHLRNDMEASLLIRCLQVIGARLQCQIYVEHAPRRASPAAKAADDLSREATSPLAFIHAKPTDLSNTSPLHDWLKKPCLDWNLPLKISDFIS